MIIDAREFDLRAPQPADLCIVGAGPAGMALALELDGSALRVVVVEAGGDGYDAATQRLFDGHSRGDRFPPLRDTRLAALGGSSGVWAGHCRPLDTTDFDAPPGGTGWPFGRETLDPYYRRAHRFFGLPGFDYEAGPGVALPLPDGGLVTSILFHLDLGRIAARYRHRLEASRNIELVQHAPATRLALTACGEKVERLQVRTLTGREFDVVAQRYVLAAGGIENARLLLLSGRSPEQAPGNSHGLVGRYFADHPFVDPGFLEFRTRATRLDFYLPHRHGTATTAVRGALSLRPDRARAQGLANGALMFYPPYEAHVAFATEAVREFLEGVAKLRGKAVPGGAMPLLARALKTPLPVAVACARRVLVRNGASRRWRLRAMFETGFHYDNRVVLDDTVDALGRRRARVEWQLHDGDIDGMRRFVAILDDAFRRSGLGAIRRTFPDEPAAWRRAAIGGKHHMGTTRMHRDPAAGVVNSDCQVHGVANLFVAGSSVFPTSGFANPTLTLVALAIRLADHLRRS